MSTAKPVVAIVDDEEGVRRALQRLIRSGGFAAETFPSGEAFLDALPTRQPDCVVLDLHMPGVNGFDVQSRIADSHLHLPVIVITGHDTTESQARVLAAGAAAYLRKPVDGEALLDAIARSLANREAKQEKEGPGQATRTDKEAI